MSANYSSKLLYTKERSHDVLEAKASYKENMDFKVIRNDITDMKEKVDAIVLPANKQLRIGSGTSKAIFEKAGRTELEEACRDIKKYVKNIFVGGAYPTEAFKLDANYIIHAVVPKWKDGLHEEYELLESAYNATLNICDEMECNSVAFPLLCSGNNGFDIKMAFAIAEECIKSFEPKGNLEMAFLVLYDEKSVEYAKSQGYDEIPEHIDNEYVKTNDERHVTLAEEMAKKALVWISDPQNQKMLLETADKVVREIKK